MSMIRLLLELLENGIDINIKIKMSEPPPPIQPIKLECPYDGCHFVTKGHKSRQSAERALRSHQNHCIHQPELEDVMAFIDEMHSDLPDGDEN